MSPILITDINKFSDRRGEFYESYKSSHLAKYGIDVTFVQDNQSSSRFGTVRGLHYQWDKPIGKLVRVSKWAIKDVVVNIDSNSAEFGRVYSFYLSDSNLNQLWVPPHYAHGFVALADDTTVHYKCSSEYNKNGESGINPLCPFLNIDWVVDANLHILSDKDKAAQSFEDYKKNPKF